MSQHLTQIQIEGYGRSKLSAADLLFVSDHLDECEACRREVERALDGDATFLALRSDIFNDAAETLSSFPERSHLTFEQTAGYVDGTLTAAEREVIIDHLTNCEQCAAAVNDLRAFSIEVAPDLGHPYRASQADPPIESGWQRFRAALFHFSPRSYALVFGSALTAILLVVTGWLIWRALRVQETGPQIVVVPSPSVTPSVTPDLATAPIIAQLNDGQGQVALDQKGNLIGVEHLPLAYQQMVKRALANQPLEKSPLLAGLNRPKSALMAGGDDQEAKFSVIEPIGKVLLSDRPTFRWSRLDGATSYVVEVYNERFNLVFASPRLTENLWRSLQPLKRGGVYLWQVKAIKDGQEFISPRPPAPQGKFRILDEARANELKEAQRNYASSHLLLGILYARAGLLNEAEQEWRTLQKNNPDSAIVRQLLANVKSRV